MMEDKPRLLVVEDDPHLRKAVLIALRAEGFTVEEAADGEAGLRAALSGEWACILTDTMMPRMDGIEMLRILREKGSRAVPVLLVSAAYILPSPDELKALGVSEVIPKPFSFDKLILSVKSLCAPLGR